MLHPKELFSADANRMAAEIRAVMPHWYRPMPSFAGEVDYGYEMYRNCNAGTLGMLVLGDESIRGDQALVSNMGASAVTVAPVAESIINRNPGASKVSGAVLNEKFWWPFFNDCWVMGGVHAKHEFHLGHADWPVDGDLWDSRNRRPTMLGRELLILSISGYSLRKSPLGMVFYNTDHMKAFNLRLTTIYTLVPGTVAAAFILRIKSAF